MLRAFFMVGAGGFAGSICRYGVSYLTTKYYPTTFPAGTFIINITGCLLIGILYGLSLRNNWLQDAGWLLLATGFCGGFTTFSAFALDNVKLMQQQLNFLSLLYVISSTALGIIACKTGIWLTQISHS
jgi:CrcB protein